ncbi:flagellar biosynthetic protein FliQ [Caminicella sporogenes DSM 14501]|uniref:Flagellar biosynthetic protein FliQ n=1 Tax=Caminicella sporogenes DSM 14501 TaxID=1121266 RepID=A0A1M6LBA8_9FIRM|nr:flagellar biosynthesis protein FliQ [Caminicella sporogenes]RKD27772.1 EscS/YscS/HrcS family type III secretion system export apparatus protein [Caminicella sporogenes]WIF94651.1 flagellar biosynthesis protein FliQ [Caminicella sporogenes]SHJ68444.1 flagellar biosynthetic protein FliQ [Caminicella sporogenes DSM 14501]
MDENIILDLFQHAMLNIILLSAPMLLIGLLVGLAVSIFQATTQIQEATLAFVPKILAVFISLVIFSPWLLRKAIDFANFVFSNINNFVK